MTLPLPLYTHSPPASAVVGLDAGVDAGPDAGAGTGCFASLSSCKLQLTSVIVRQVVVNRYLQHSYFERHLTYWYHNFDQACLMRICIQSE
jgi:hypothetical protein